MPSIAGHMAIAKRVSEKLNINSPDFIRGNLLPDLYNDKVKSHFKINGKKYMIPDIDKAVKDLDIKKDLYLGYICHLLLDKYYFDEYMIKYEGNLFDDTIIYNDYDIINHKIVDYFKLDLDYIVECLNNYSITINNRKLEKNIDCLLANINGKTNILDVDDFINFLDKISNRIANELRGIMEENNG